MLELDWTVCVWYGNAAITPTRSHTNPSIPRPPKNKQLFKYNGAGPLYEAKFEEGPSLFDAQFRPAAPGTFPDRPATPPRKGEEAASAAVVPPPTVTPKPRAVYRPPGSTGACFFGFSVWSRGVIVV